MTLTPRQLDALFGPGTSDDPYQRALESSARFVRSQDHLVPFTEGARGHVLSAWEAWITFGPELLAEILEYGSAIIVSSEDEPSRTLRERRQDLGLDEAAVAKAAGLSVSDVRDAEDPSTRTPIARLERLAATLGLDERELSVRPGAAGDEALAARLKSLGEEKHGRLDPRSVLSLAESAHLIAVQDRLACWLRLSAPVNRHERFQPDSFYGNVHAPAWEQGFRLARETRARLGIQTSKPIECMWRLLEEQLGIPVIKTELPTRIAGATLGTRDTRGIVINTRGSNANVWVRRATLAHELCHLLWDPDERLERLRVDSYRELDRDPDQVRDEVEQRANAFAIELLAPQKALREMASGAADLSSVLRDAMERFGISFTAASYHLWNALERNFDRGTLHADPEPTDEWKGREAFDEDYFPLADTPISRRGRFCGLTLAAERAGVISHESAATYLRTTPDRLAEETDALRSLFPELVERAAASVDEMRRRGRLRRRRDVQANHEWLQTHASSYQGQWVALADGEIVAAAPRLRDVMVAVERRGLLRRDVLVFQIGADHAHA